MRKIILKLFLLVFVGIIGCFVLLTLPRAYASTLSEVDIKEEYMLNYSLSIPTATLTVNGKAETASHIITFPSGKVYDKSDVVLNELGMY